MQQLASRPQPDQQANRGGAPRSQVILIVALLFFSLAGLASGFSVGAMTGKTTKTPQSNTQITNIVPAVKGQITTPTQAKKTIDILAVGIGCPNITSSSYAQIADNTTTYTAEAQVMDKSKEKKSVCGQGKALLAPGITCKIWITKDLESLLNLQKTSTKMLLDVKKLPDSFPHEKANTLLLHGSSQVQNCNPNGVTTWKYTLASNTDPGIYFITVLTDWEGQQWNWKWNQINVTKAN